MEFSLSPSPPPRPEHAHRASADFETILAQKGSQRIKMNSSSRRKPQRDARRHAKLGGMVQLPV